MRFKPVIHMAAAFGLCAGIASAQGRAERFVERDGNGDGVLSPHEYQSTGGHAGNFHALDTNGDGVLTRGEFLGREGTAQDDSVLYDDSVVYKGDPGIVGQDPNVMVKVPFRKLDVNRDNVLTKREWDVDARTFRSLDRNRDGYISAAEYADAPLTGLGGIGPGAIPTGFVAKDRNRDGTLTRAEYGDARTFDRVDSNDDGRITADEFRNPPPADSVRGRFDDLDRNDDGNVSRREWSGPMADFRSLDRNRDGRISRYEFGS